VILSDLLAPRKIVINVLSGHATGVEPLSEERMREMIKAADSERLRKGAHRSPGVVTARAEVERSLARRVCW
jgi:hypothetical protein